MEMNSWLQNVAPIFADVMGEQGKRELGMQAAKIAGFDNVESMFPGEQHTEARAAAYNLFLRIINSGVYEEPQQGEKHGAWLAVLEPLAKQYAMVPDRDDDALQRLSFHIERRKAMAAQAAQPVPQDQPQAAPQLQQGLEGEIAANPIEAQEGAVAGA
jgi:hypothetical protein